MKTLLPKLLFILALLTYPGCNLGPGSDSPDDLARSNASFCARFGPKRLDILPLTHVASSSSPDATINVYVSLIDAYDSQIKAPTIVRFELFQYVERSTDHKGKRTAIWPDIDLTDPDTNNNYWQDFLRAYLFSLPVQKSSVDSSILQVTCLCPSGRRISGDFIIRPAR